MVTSNVRGAGTDGALFIELTGTGPTGAAVSAGPWCLDRSGAFARGSTDTFIVEGTEVATPRTLQVTLQGASLNPDWHLNHVACTLLDGQDDAEGTKYYFSGERCGAAAFGCTALPNSGSRQGGLDNAATLVLCLCGGDYVGPALLDCSDRDVWHRLCCMRCVQLYSGN